MQVYVTHGIQAVHCVDESGLKLLRQLPVCVDWGQLQPLWGLVLRVQYGAPLSSSCLCVGVCPYWGCSLVWGWFLLSVWGVVLLWGVSGSGSGSSVGFSCRGF